MRVAVLSCGDLGVEVANVVIALPEVGQVVLLQAPWREPRRRGPWRLLRDTLRMEGPPGVCRAIGRRLGLVRAAPCPGPEAALDPAVERIRVADFHDDEALARLRGFAPDLGVVAGTYILRESVFGLPKGGCINLHSGKAPEYRGSEPAFWELYNGEREVGITIHRVARKLDAGHVLRQKLLPLDPAPAGDPVRYLDRYRRDVLRPHGVRLVSEVVAALARGEASETPQDPVRARTYRRPTYAQVRELRRRVARRRHEVR